MRLSLYFMLYSFCAPFYLRNHPYSFYSYFTVISFFNSLFCNFWQLLLIETYLWSCHIILYCVVSAVSDSVTGNLFVLCCSLKNHFTPYAYLSWDLLFLWCLLWKLFFVVILWFLSVCDITHYCLSFWFGSW